VEPCLGHQQCAQRSPSILDCHQETRSRERWCHSSRQTWPPLATAPGRLGLPSPRRVMQQLNNQPRQGGNSGEKRERASSSAALVSPSKVRHRLFVEEARKILPGERLTHCPLCTSPSRVSASKAECSSSKCNFVFCPDCLCENHEGRGCRLTRTGSKVPKSGAVTSKKSKARLRRL